MCNFTIGFGSRWVMWVDVWMYGRSMDGYVNVWMNGGWVDVCLNRRMCDGWVDR